jgi:hypothetical protein
VAPFSSDYQPKSNVPVAKFATVFMCLDSGLWTIDYLVRCRFSLFFGEPASNSIAWIDEFDRDVDEQRNDRRFMARDPDVMYFPAPRQP